ncbi:hypothetical protein MRX96_008453 [Rhipicephalus microplus]
MVAALCLSSRDGGEEYTRTLGSFFSELAQENESPHEAEKKKGSVGIAELVQVNKIPDFKNVLLKKDAYCNPMNGSRNVPGRTA